MDHVAAIPADTALRAADLEDVPTPTGVMHFAAVHASTPISRFSAAIGLSTSFACAV
jgi:hypothetical protein